MGDNYVSIKVKADNGAKPDLTDLRARLAELNGKVATARAEVNDAAGDAKLTDLQAKLEAISKKVASPKIDMAGAARALAQLTAVDAAMDDLGRKGGKDGEKAGGGWLSGFKRALTGGKLNDVSSQLGGSGLGKDVEGKGREDGGLFHNSFVTTFLGGLKGTIITGVGMAMAALPALGAVAGVGLVAGLGVMIASKIPSVAAQFKGLGTQIMGGLEKDVKPLLPFISGVVKQIGGFFKSIGPELSGLFKNVGPMLMPLTKGLEGLIKGLLPGLSTILKSAGPAVSVFAKALGTLGGDLGGMFKAMAPAVAASAVVLKALLGVLGGLFPVIGKIAGSLAGALAPVLKTIAGAFKSLEPVLAAVGKVLAEFAQAFLVNLAGGLSAVAGLVKAIAPAFGILAGVLGKVFNLMNNRGVFNDLEDAIEGLVGPLGKLIIALVSGLAPILPPIISVAGALAGVVQGVLVTAVTALVPVLIPVIGLLSQLLQEAIVPLLPFITRLASMLGGFLGQAVKALLPAVGQLVGALLQILIALTPLLPPLAQLITLAVQLAMLALKPVIGLVTILARWLADLAGVIAVAVGWIAKIVAAALTWITQFGNLKKVVGDVVGFIKEHWKLLATILATLLLGPVAGLVVFIATHWKQISHDTSELYSDVTRFFSRMASDVTSTVARWYHDVLSWADRLFADFNSVETRGIDNIVSWFKGLPGRIMSAIGNLGNLLLNAGAQVVEGLIHGIESKFGDLGSVAGSIGSHLLGGVKDVLGIFSPSREFAKLGGQITAGLALGINSTRQQAVDEARFLAQQVADAYMSGDITASQEKDLRKKIAASLATALKGGVQDALATGTIAQIGAATQKLLKTIWDTAAGGFTTRTQASGLAEWVKADNVRLQALARERNKIAATIAAAKAYDASTASAAEGTYDLSSAAGSGSTPAPVSSIISALQGDVGKIRQFSANIKKLAKEGLSRAYISQLIAMGPDQGAALAAELAAAGLGQIKSINTAESQITSASNQLGGTAANAMYDSGKQAGKGFLSGLQAQQKSITKLMSTIAASMVGQLRKDLGIASPSKVMHQHGADTLQGYINGWKSKMPELLALVHQAGGAISGAGAGYSVGSSGLSARALGPAGGPLQLEVTVRVEGDGRLTTAIGDSMKVYVREKGGGGKYSTQKALGRVWPAG